MFRSFQDITHYLKLELQERLMDFRDWLFLFDIVELVKDLL